MPRERERERVGTQTGAAEGRAHTNSVPGAQASRNCGYVDEDEDNIVAVSTCMAASTQEHTMQECVFWFVFYRATCVCKHWVMRVCICLHLHGIVHFLAVPCLPGMPRCTVVQVVLTVMKPAHVDQKICPQWSPGMRSMPKMPTRNEE